MHLWTTKNRIFMNVSQQRSELLISVGQRDKNPHINYNASGVREAERIKRLKMSLEALAVKFEL